jgi:hypothetical protein
MSLAFGEENGIAVVAEHGAGPRKAPHHLAWRRQDARVSIAATASFAELGGATARLC